MNRQAKIKHMEKHGIRVKICMSGVVVTTKGSVTRTWTSVSAAHRFYFHY